MKIFGRLWPTGKETGGIYLFKLLSVVAIMYGACVLLAITTAEALFYTGVLDRPKDVKAYYDIDDPVCHTSDGTLIVWINSDNWIEVTGTDQEEIAELVAKRIGRKDKP